MRLTLSFLILLLGLPAQASDLFAPFQGSRVSGLTRTSTIFESDGTIDAAGNLLDLSGSNYCLASEQMDLWTLGSVYTAVVANQYRSPIDNQLSADAVKEYGASGGGDATAYHYIQKTMGAASVGVRYTLSGYFRKVNRDWIMLQPYDATAGTERAKASFNLNTGAIGSYTTTTTANISKVSGSWYRISVSWIQPADSLSVLFVISALEADNDRQYAGSDQVAFAVVGAQMAKNDKWRQGPGIYHPTSATVTKPLHDLAPTSAPTSSYSYLQNRDGNRLQARAFSGANYYSLAHHDSMNIFDGNFVVTQVVKSPAAAPGSNIMSFTHGQGNTSGCYMNMGSLGYYYLFCNNSGASPTTKSVYQAVSFADGRYHTVQGWRTNNVMNITVDGISATPADATGYGVDASRTFYIGSYDSTGNWTSDILYTRIDAAGMTQEELAKDREALQGTLMGSGNLAPGSTFTRTTTASMTYANGTIGYVAANVPRVGGDGGGVLVEEQRENKATYSQTFGTGWSKRDGDVVTSDSATILAPDGTATAEGLAADALDQTHYFSQGVTTTAATWTMSVWFYPGNKDWARISCPSIANAQAWFNVRTCRVGTIGAAVTAANTMQYANGWCRGWVSYTSTAASVTIGYYLSEADNDLTFVGDGATVNTWFWGAQVELGAHPTSYIPTTSASVTRTQDSLTLEPWKLNKGVNPGFANPTMTARFESDVYATGTYTTETGAKNFVVNGDTKHQVSQTMGDWFAFDGTGDYLVRTDSAFNPSGDFTVVAIVTPATVAAGGKVIASKWITAGNQHGWSFWQSGADVNFGRTTDGTDGTLLTATEAAALTAGKTSLITASYSTTSGLMVVVDGMAAATQAATGVVYPSTGNFLIGCNADLSPYFNGKIHLVKYIDGYAATTTDHTNMLAQLKQANVLPVKIGNSHEAKKLYVEFDAKCLYTGTNDFGGVPLMLDIAGNTGASDLDTNRFGVYRSGATTYAVIWPDGESTNRYMSVTSLDLSQWHHYKFYLDFAELANSTGYVDTTAFTNHGSLAGAKNFDLTNARIRVGQNYADVTNGDCRYKNLRVRAAP